MRVALRSLAEGLFIEGVPVLGPGRARARSRCCTAASKTIRVYERVPGKREVV
jgi:hypothetical protein